MEKEARRARLEVGRDQDTKVEFFAALMDDGLNWLNRPKGLNLLNELNDLNDLTKLPCALCPES